MSLSLWCVASLNGFTRALILPIAISLPTQRQMLIMRACHKTTGECSPVALIKSEENLRLYGANARMLYSDYISTNDNKINFTKIVWGNPWTKWWWSWGKAYCKWMAFCSDGGWPSWIILIFNCYRYYFNNNCNTSSLSCCIIFLKLFKESIEIF